LPKSFVPRFAASPNRYLIGVHGRGSQAGLKATRNAYRLTGWVAADNVRQLAEELERVADGRVAMRAYDRTK
jgi:hypothetical protein